MTKSLQVEVPKLHAASPGAHLQDVIEDLADQDQVVLYFQLWRVEDGQAFAVTNADGSCGAELDYAEPWPELVVHAREWALLHAGAITPDATIMATIEWIDRADL